MYYATAYGIDYAEGKYHSYVQVLPLEKLRGFQWLFKKTVRAHVVLDGQSPYGSVTLDKPKFEIMPIVNEHTVRFRIKLKLTGTVSELFEKKDIPQIEKEAAEAVKREIMQAYRNGLQIEADIFRLGDRAYRYRLQAWKRVSADGTRFFLDERSIEQLDVKVKLRSAGRYKSNRKNS
ncbi:Ger(x)C family spore germination C-terminal domain-containing protein [Paenibacillus tarimensis]